MPAITNETKPSSLIFLHIPKAAGTTLHEIIERQYKVKDIFTIDGVNHWEDVNKFKQLPLEKRKHIKILKGHMGFGLHEFLPESPTYITLLRNPIDRVISTYYYVLRRPNHALYQVITSQNISLEDFVKIPFSERKYIDLDNMQTRYLAGILGEPDQTIDDGKYNEQMLARAKQNLKQYFSVFGPVEEFDLVLLLFQDYFGWKNVFYRVKNQTKKRPLQEKINDNVLEIIQERNKLDIELYDYSISLFREKIEQKQQYFEKKIIEFEQQNKSLGVRFNTYRSITINKLRKKMETILTMK